MGMFDTIEFPREIKCIVCGETHTYTQTKQFENILAVYRVGEMLPGNIHTGLLEESITCCHTSMQGEDVKTSFNQKIYFVIWHHILIDVVENVEEGEKILSNFGIGELLGLYELEHQRKINFETKYRRVKTYVRTFLFS